jgi:hypothetical protein
MACIKLLPCDSEQDQLAFELFCGFEGWQMTLTSAACSPLPITDLHMYFMFKNTV